MNRAALLVVAAVLLLPVVVRPAIATEIWIFAICGLGDYRREHPAALHCPVRDVGEPVRLLAGRGR